MMLSPIAVFAFKRSGNLSSLLKELGENSLFQEHPLFIFIDGPRVGDEVEAVSRVRAVAEAFIHPHKTVIAQSENKGLRNSLESGISLILTMFDTVIVLEEDLVAGPVSLTYFQTALDTYKNVSQVRCICGYAIGGPAKSDFNGCSLLPMTHPWGWATWRDRWDQHMLTVSTNNSMDSRAFAHSFNVFGLRRYTLQLTLAERGEISSWWIYWHLSLIRNHGLTLFPNMSQTAVRNFASKEATHASAWNFLFKMIPNQEISSVMPHFPTGLSLDFERLEEIICSREARVSRIINDAGYLKRVLQRIFGRHSR